jgi:hypothetical protein
VDSSKVRELVAKQALGAVTSKQPLLVVVVGQSLIVAM